MHNLDFANQRLILETREGGFSIGRYLIRMLFQCLRANTESS